MPYKKDELWWLRNPGMEGKKEMIIIGVVVVTGLYALLASMAIAAAYSDAKIQKIMAEKRETEAFLKRKEIIK